MSQPPNEHPLLILTKDQNQIFDYYARKVCKILKFPPDWTLEEILYEISKLSTQMFSNLFIFIIGHKSFELSIANGEQKKLKVDTAINMFQKSLKNFKCNRSVYLKIISKNEPEPKFYCRYEDTEEFYEMDSIDFVDELDDRLLGFMVDNDNILNPTQTFVDEIYEKVFKKLFKTTHLIKNYKAGKPKQVKLEVYNDKPAEDVAGPSGYKPNNFKVVSSYEFEDIYLPAEKDAKNHKFAIISKNINSYQNWINKNLLKKFRALNPAMWISYGNLKHFYNKFGPQNEIDIETIMTENVLQQNSKLEAEIFKKLYKNGKVCILLGEFDDSDPNFVEFITRFCRTFQENGGNQLWMTIRDAFEVNSTDQLELEIIFNLKDANEFELELAKQKSLNFNEILRNSIEKHFKIPKILEMINIDKCQADQLIFIDYNSTLGQTRELTIEQIPKTRDESNITSFKDMDEDSGSILHVLVKKCELDNLKYIWKKLELLAESEKMFKEFLDIRTLEKSENFLHIAGKCDIIQVHEVIWDLLRNSFIDLQELMSFTMQKNKISDNFIHCIILNGNSAIIKFTLEKIKEIFSFNQYNTIIKSTGQFDRNFLQLAAIGSKDNIIFQFIWNLFETSLESYDQFLMFILNADQIGQNIFHLAAAHSSIDLIKFIIFELLKITPQENINSKLCELDSDGCNLLQIAAIQMKPLQYQQNLWELVKNNCGENNFWMMLKNIDHFGDNVLCKAIQLHSIDVVRFMWNQFKKILLRNPWFEFSNYNEISEKNWTQIANEFNPALIEFCDEMQAEFEALGYAVGGEHDMDCMIIEEPNNKSDQPEMHQLFFENPPLIPLKTTYQQPREVTQPNCRILRFSHNEISSKVTDLKPQVYPNLFMIIIEDSNFEFSDSNIGAKWRSSDITALQLSLSNFYRLCSMFMKLTSINEKESKLFVKQENDHEFSEVTVEEFVDKMEVQNLRYLAENEEILLNLETIFEEKFLKIFYQPRKFLKSYKIDGLESSIEEIDMIKLEDSSHEFDANSFLNGNNVMEIIESMDTNQSNFDILSDIQSNSHKATINNLDNIKLQEITDNELLEDTKNHKYILISGKTGSGRSWALKNIKIKLQQRDLKIWLIYIDLCQLSETVEERFSDTNFENFIADYIFSQNTNLEAEIFKKLYKNGKVCILFDGFDKIPKDFADSCMKICQTFQQNDGNQLYISTNNKNEENLMESLKIEAVYKLNDLIDVYKSDNIAACRQLIQIEVAQNKSLENHQILWKFVHKFFNLTELNDLIKHTEYDEDNLILKVIGTYSKEVVELTLTELRNILNQKSENGFLGHLQHVNKHSETILHLIIKQKDSKSLEIFFEAIKSFLTPQQLQELINQKTTTKHENILQLAAKCDNLEFHETFWKILLNIFEDRDNLLELIMQKNRFGDNFTHYLVVHDKPDIIEFTFNKLKEIFSPTQYQTILKSKGQHGRNLLQAATVSAKSLETHQILWKLFKNNCNSNLEFTEYLEELDETSNNIFHLAACFTSKENFEFMIRELERVTKPDDIKRILTTLGLAGKNLLQSAARQNYSIELHRTLWDVLINFVGLIDLWGMIKHADQFGDNVLADVIECNTHEIAFFIWSQIKKFLNRNDADCRDLNVERFSGRDLVQLSLENNTDPDVRDFCKKVLAEYKSLLQKSEIFKPVKYVAVNQLPQPIVEYNYKSLKQQHKYNLQRPGMSTRRPY